jgi:hypothetical protein
LQAARKAAGFETAAAAAAHFEWSLGRYRSHESGARNIPDEDVRRYAKAFKVTGAYLHDPDWETVDRQLERARKTAEAPKIEIARRLRCARILRGLPSAAAASKALGIGTPSYLKHENGGNGLHSGMPEFYAQEFRISRNWLLTGQLPSGLGASIDSRIRAVLRDPRKFAGHANAPHSFHEEPPAILKTGRPTGITSVPEYRSSDLARHAGDVSLAKPCGVVQFPSSSSAEFGDDTLFSVLVDTDDPRLRHYSRVFATRSFLSFLAPAEYLVFSGCDVCIITLDHEALRDGVGLIGRVVGKLEALPFGD